MLEGDGTMKTLAGFLKDFRKYASVELLEGGKAKQVQKKTGVYGKEAEEMCTYLSPNKGRKDRREGGRDEEDK